MSIFYVYILFKPWNGEPFYVGKGKGSRWTQHEGLRRHYNPIMRRILAKAKRLGLEIPRVKIREGLSETEAFEIETAFIKAIGRNQNGGPLANKTDGGEGISGFKQSRETVERISAARRGMKCDPQWCANVSASLIGNKNSLGRKHPPSTLDKMAESQKKRWSDPEYIEKMRVIRKEQASVEYRASRSAVLKAQWADPIFRKQMLEARELARKLREDALQVQSDGISKLLADTNNDIGL